MLPAKRVAYDTPSTPALSSFLYRSQPIPPSNLGPSAHFAKLEHVQSSCRPAGISDNDGFPLVLWPGQDIGAIPLTRNHLHNLEPPEHCEEKQRQDQQNSCDDCCCHLSSKVPLNDAAPPCRPSSDQEGEGLRNRKPSCHTGKARKIGPLLSNLFRQDTTWSARHSWLKIRCVKCFHDQTVTFCDGKVGKKSNQGSKNDGRHKMHCSVRREGVPQPSKGQYDCEGRSSHQVRSPSHPFFESHTIRPLLMMPRAAQDVCFLERDCEQCPKGYAKHSKAHKLRSEMIVLREESTKQLQHD